MSRARRALPVALLLLGGCAADHSALNPENDAAGRVADLGVAMIVIATVITLLVFGLLLYGLVRRRRRTEGRWQEDRIVIAGGVLLPVVVLLPLSAATVAVLDEQPEDAGFTIEVVAHQYWWELRYPDHGFETANEIHIPVGTTVDVVLRSDDVIHSFWVPRLGGKIDTVPGRTNHLVLEADRAGTYRGQCAEYCGLQHAKMIFLVIAEPEDEFEAWAAEQREDAVRPASGAALRGAEVFREQACAGCHVIRGTDAEGAIGPDLTHVAGRDTIAAGVLPNTPDDMARWIAETWEVKEGAIMPPVPLDEADLDDLVAYLETLR